MLIVRLSLSLSSFSSEKCCSIYSLGRHFTVQYYTSTSLCCCFWKSYSLLRTLPSVASWTERALSIMIHTKSYPLYVHCLDGRRVTGILVALFRKLQKRSCQISFAEYWIYQLGTSYSKFHEPTLLTSINFYYGDKIVMILWRYFQRIVACWILSLILIKLPSISRKFSLRARGI